MLYFFKFKKLKYFLLSMISTIKIIFYFIINFEHDEENSQLHIIDRAFLI